MIIRLKYRIFLFSLFLQISFLYGFKTIDDFSQLNKTIVSNIYYPVSIDEIEQIVQLAKSTGKQISIAGKRHSQGGHTFYNDSIVIDINKFNKILNLDVTNKVITVQTGVTWEQIQEFINPHNLAIKVMQTAQIFTIGGSLSVNAHGRDPNFGPLIETIKKIKILLANGKIITASREENYDLFKLAIGGYGLFGIIVEADIELTDNLTYQKETQVIDFHNYEKFVNKNVIQNKNIGLHYGILCLTPYDFLKKMVVVNYNIISTQKSKTYKLENEKHISFNQFRLYLKKQSGIFYFFSKISEWHFIILRERMPHTTSRNNAMQHPAKCLDDMFKAKNSDLLQSYFIPTNKFIEFIDYLRSSMTEKNIKIFYAFTRYIRKNTESFLSYTNDNFFEIVLHITHEKTVKDIENTESWTQNLVSKVIELKGTYYLPVQLYPTQKQLELTYPQIYEFFNKKTQYDPTQLFVNHFYKKYYGLK